jgi:hypothetical protein
MGYTPLFSNGKNCNSEIKGSKDNKRGKLFEISITFIVRLPSRGEEYKSIFRDLYRSAVEVF